MFTLTDVEVAALKASTDPAIMAAMAKLIKAESDGEFIPKSRLTEVIAKRNEAEGRVALLEREKTENLAASQKTTHDLQVLLDAEKTARGTAETTLAEEKKIAEQFRAYHKNSVEAAKKQLGDKWLPEYETFSLESLAKIPGVDLPRLGVITALASLPADKFFTQAEIEALPPSELKGDVLKKVNESLEHIALGRK